MQVRGNNDTGIGNPIYVYKFVTCDLGAKLRRDTYSSNTLEVLYNTDKHFSNNSKDIC